ncbi:hypothetical protein Acy02nite_86780 [Actinoplanes cyaneus]|uniref:Uncharacterized protein n=1 Tax=Actinoplanes cyaneus TaxID=52696 RepID=A0A919IT31_9ACTN|nr:hypothetical protein Acy02nite_86780 [Actinoplanes cyaneus]
MDTEASQPEKKRCREALWLFGGVARSDCDYTRLSLVFRLGEYAWIRGGNAAPETRPREMASG